jgi:peptidyl-prolyl cis-trans isomerase B (cyclophilin B)
MRRLPASVAVLLVLAACSAGPSPTPPPACPTAAPTTAEGPAILADADLATVRTNKGDFTMDLYGDAAPLATANFVLLARCGFYDGISFHRVIPDFVIQAGDPQTTDNHGDFQGLGTGGPGYHFTIEPPADDLAYDRYVVAMANAGGTDTNGSQFFIDLADLDTQLRQVGVFTIFGKVVSGTEVVDAIGALPTSGDPMNVPLDPAIIEGIEISAASPSASPSA